VVAAAAVAVVVVIAAAIVVVVVVVVAVAAAAVAVAVAVVVMKGRFVRVHAIQPHSFLNSALDEISSQLHSPGPLCLRKEPALYSFSVRLGGPQSGLELLERVKCLAAV